MLKAIMIICCICTSHFAICQDDFKGKVSKVLYLIERNLHNAKERVDSVEIDFFVYDISIKESGGVQDIHLLILDSLSNTRNIHKVAARIKEEFNVGKSKYKKIFIPVMILYTVNDEINSEKYKWILKTLDFFETVGRMKMEDVFVTRIVTIQSYSTSK